MQKITIPSVSMTADSCLINSGFSYQESRSLEGSIDEKSYERFPIGSWEDCESCLVMNEQDEHERFKFL